MTKKSTLLSGIDPADLLAELEDIMRAMPPSQSLRIFESPETIQWFGRVLALLNNWSPAIAMEGRNAVAAMRTGMNFSGSYVQLMTILEQARSDLRMRTIGPVNIAIGQGRVFDYFDELRKIIELANTDILFVDPYLDADFVSKYLGFVKPGFLVRMLGGKRQQTLIPALQAFSAQSDQRLELRSGANLHDRYVFIDRSTCYQSGASFKDGAARADTTLTQITDVFGPIQKWYEDYWKNGNVLLSV